MHSAFKGDRTCNQQGRHIGLQFAHRTLMYSAVLRICLNPHLNRDLSVCLTVGQRGDASTRVSSRTFSSPQIFQQTRPSVFEAHLEFTARLFQSRSERLKDFSECAAEVEFEFFQHDARLQTSSRQKASSKKNSRCSSSLVGGLRMSWSRNLNCPLTLNENRPRLEPHS